MRAWVFRFLVFSQFWLAGAQTPGGLPSSNAAISERSGVDPRVELMSIIFGFRETRSMPGALFQPMTPPSRVTLRASATTWRFGWPALRNRNGVSYSGGNGHAIQVKDVESLAERDTLDPRWHGAKARGFLEAARRFAAYSDFAGFLKSQQHLFDVTSTRLRAFAAGNADLPWFDRFFGPRNHTAFIVVPVFNSATGSFGANTKLASGDEEVYALLGVGGVDAEGFPQFYPPGYTPFLVHEICHYYVEPLIDKFKSELDKPAHRLVEPVSADQRRRSGTKHHRGMAMGLVSWGNRWCA